MAIVELRFRGYRYFPYERRLAAMEAERLLGARPEEVPGGLRVRAPGPVGESVLQRLTYFGEAAAADGPAIVPQQPRLEDSAGRHARTGGFARQQTRYSAHGLHEYRGKFHPQIVRAILNLLRLEPGARLWDPFCGSGTVLLEARHQGYDALGVDMNPLAVTIANAKIAAVGAPPDTLRDAARLLAERVRERAARLDGIAAGAIGEVLGEGWRERFPCPEYLGRWFPAPVLAQLRIVLDAIGETEPAGLREVFRIVLSDILRGVSWQDPGDLRVRRRKDPVPDYPAAGLFAEALEARVRTVTAASEHLPRRKGRQFAVLGDSRDVRSMGRRAGAFLRRGVDCVIGSPPYAAALPYIDTQRLSIALLGMVPAGDIRMLDAALTGSREMTARERCEIEESMERNGAGLASEAWRMCRALKDAWSPDSDGFRRRNTPAVAYRYFAGMTQAMRTARQCLKSGGALAFVVGPSRTTLGGSAFTIDTPALLAATGESVGLRLSETHELDAYGRYEARSRNSIRREQLLVMTAP